MTSLIFFYLTFLKFFGIIYIENKKGVIIIRLWHQSLIPYLDRQRLLGAHRECCALRGMGWGKKHATVDYVFKYATERLVAYHYLIMDEMKHRGYNPDETWYKVNWRGKILGEQQDWADYNLVLDIYGASRIYPEHNDDYLKECIDNLRDKGVDVSEMEGLINNVQDIG